MLCIDRNVSSFVGTISTIVSIVLGMMSFIYSYVSGKQTLEYLNEIKEENDKLVERLNYELSKENYGDKNVENIDMMIKEIK